MRVLVVNIPTGKPDSPFGDWARERYVPLLKKNIDLVKSPDTEVTFRFAEWGMYPVDMAYYRYLDHLAGEMVFHAAQHAEEEGFDAVMIDCFGDPMVYELRQALDIPVVAIGEASMLLTSMMCDKFGIVAISPLNIPETWEHLERYRIAGSCIQQLPIEGWEQGDGAGEDEGDDLADCGDKLERFMTTAKKLVAMGAEAIIPGCSITSPMVRLCPGQEDKYPNGVTEIDGAAVIDIIGESFKITEALASLRKGGSSWVSRKCKYAQPSDQIRKEALPITTSDKFRFWDIS